MDKLLDLMDRGYWVRIERPDPDIGTKECEGLDCNEDALAIVFVDEDASMRLKEWGFCYDCSDEVCESIYLFCTRT